MGSQLTFLECQNSSTVKVGKGKKKERYRSPNIKYGEKGSNKHESDYIGLRYKWLRTVPVFCKGDGPLQETEPHGDYNNQDRF